MPTFEMDKLIVNVTPGHNKFWRGQRLGVNAYVTFGRIGADKPQRTVKPFRSAYEADRYIVRTASEKCRKGYTMVVGSASGDRILYPDCTPILPPDTPTLGSTPQSPSAVEAPVRGTATRGLELD